MKIITLIKTQQNS